jgi:hypothetical protein
MAKKKLKAGKQPKEPVIFRKFPNGDIIAMFPMISVDQIGYNCQSYMHVGQHGAASPQMVTKQTKLATPDEYAVLEDELERVVGYDLRIIKRFQYCYQLYRMLRAKNSKIGIVDG